VPHRRAGSDDLLLLFALLVLDAHFGAELDSSKASTRSCFPAWTGRRLLEAAEYALEGMTSQRHFADSFITVRMPRRTS
jgi:hypothetical protein